jgi:hypothetical protein
MVHIHPLTAPFIYQLNNSQESDAASSDSDSTTESSRLLRWELENHCGDPRCLRDNCWARPTVQIFIYIKVRLIMPTGDVMVRLLLPQAYRRPLQWNGYLPVAGFRFWLDHHLSHLADIATTDYYIYRAGERPHWVLAEIHGAQMVEPGEFLIYRASHIFDHACPGLSMLVRGVHASMLAAVPYRDLPRIPSRYAE